MEYKCKQRVASRGLLVQGSVEILEARCHGVEMRAGKGKTGMKEKEAPPISCGEWEGECGMSRAAVDALYLCGKVNSGQEREEEGRKTDLAGLACLDC